MMETVGSSDYSGSFSRLRGNVANAQGITLSNFRRSLEPRYWIAYRDIGLGYLAIAASVAFGIALDKVGAPTFIVVLTSAVLIGYWVAYLQLFIHEGAHWNLASERQKSDFLCNSLISWWAGQEVGEYRKVHFQHHRALGSVNDSERTYFSPLNMRFLLQSLLGVRAFAVILTRRDMVRERMADHRIEGMRILDVKRITLVAGALVHVAVLGALIFNGLWGVALGWVMGMISFFPFFGALRQLLEHRADTALSEADFASVDHGAFTRIFDGGLIAKTFGGAGFDRHLLHHWEPTVSYTRLAELEEYLLHTPLKSVIEGRRTTYGRAFWSLWREQ